MMQETPNAAVIGWTWAKACVMLDKGEDPREYEVPKLLEDFKRDFLEADF